MALSVASVKGWLQENWRKPRVLMASGAAIVVAAAAAVTGVALSGGSAPTAAPTSSAPAPTPTPTTPTPTPTPAAPALDPLTGGKPSANPVIAVKIDDTDHGRPQANLDKADIVYIEQAEGGLSRMVAVFHSSLPTVEPVRSTRASDPELLAQYGPIGFVASGGGGDSLQILHASPLQAAIDDSGSAGFARDNSRSAPYNLTADLAMIGKGLKGAKAKSIGWTWSPTPLTAADPLAPDIRTVVGSTTVTFHWVARMHEYVRMIDGVPQKAADGALLASPNVIVQFCAVSVHAGDVDVNGNPSQYTHSIGSGKLAVFRDGREALGTWSRAAAKDGTVLKDKAGQQIPLKPGGVWVALVNTGAPLSP